MGINDDDTLGLDSGAGDLIVLADGRTMSTHGPSVCLGPNCCIHDPSQHPLNTAPLWWMDEVKLMFRVCEHEAIHPDPDALAFNQMMTLVGRALPYDGWHPCCPARCCQPGSSDSPQTVTEH